MPIPAGVAGLRIQPYLACRGSEAVPLKPSGAEAVHKEKRQALAKEILSQALHKIADKAQDMPVKVRSKHRVKKGRVKQVKCHAQDSVSGCFRDAASLESCRDLQSQMFVAAFNLFWWQNFNASPERRAGRTSATFSVV